MADGGGDCVARGRFSAHSPRRLADDSGVGGVLDALSGVGEILVKIAVGFLQASSAVFCPSETAAREVVGSIQYTHAQPAERSGQGSIASISSAI